MTLQNGRRQASDIFNLNPNFYSEGDPDGKRRVWVDLPLTTDRRRGKAVQEESSEEKVRKKKDTYRHKSK